MKYQSIFPLLVLSLSQANGAVVYSEDFTGQTGTGVVGAFPQGSITTFTDPGVTWTLENVDAGDFTATSDWARVQGGLSGNLVSGEAFSIRDSDGVVTWRSPVIDISVFTSLGLTLDVEEIGDIEADNFINIAYILDGGSPVSLNVDAGPTFPFSAGNFTYEGDLPDDLDFGSDQFSASIPNGLELQIQITGMSDAGTEELLFDNILLQGDAIPEPSSSLMVLLAGGLGAMRRRRR